MVGKEEDLHVQAPLPLDGEKEWRFISIRSIDFNFRKLARSHSGYLEVFSASRSEGRSTLPDSLVVHYLLIGKGKGKEGKEIRTRFCWATSLERNTLHNRKLAVFALGSPFKLPDVGAPLTWKVSSIHVGDECASFIIPFFLIHVRSAGRGRDR